MPSKEQLEKEIEKKELELKLKKLNQQLESPLPVEKPQAFIGPQSATTRIGEIIMSIVASILCVFLIPMAWCIPFLIRQGKRKRGEIPITIGHVVVGFFFFGWIGAVLVAVGGDVQNF